jgi:predicted ATP-binding protein involved in virulence
MRILYLKICSQYKNLEGIEINFDPVENTTVIIGQNGTGKSNIFEAIVHIFKQLDEGEVPCFSYELVYKIGEGDIETCVAINADIHGDEKYQVKYQEREIGRIKEDWKELKVKDVERDKDGLSRFLPRNIFAYYSGPSDRLETLFYSKRRVFYNQIIKDDSKIRDNVRPFFYAKPFHSQFSLLAFFVARGFEHTERFLERELSIKKFNSVTFVLKKPSGWGSSDETDFWGAKGAIRDFLELIKRHCLGPIVSNIQDRADISLRPKMVKKYSYFLPNKATLYEFSKNMRPEDLFTILEATYLSGILDGVNIEVTQTKSNQTVVFSELSEGEQQLLTIFGLLQFTAKRDALFLLDEPDTHLNPHWSAKYYKFLELFIPEGFKSHIIMSTHHPLSIAELKREQIQVVKRNPETQRISVSMPDKSPRGMSVNGILTSDMFGMLTTLDNDTQSLIRERRKLVVLDNDPERLDQLNTQLEQLGYGYIHPDEDYRQFLIERSKYLEYGKEVVSVEERKKMIKSMLKDLRDMNNEIH